MNRVCLKALVRDLQTELTKYDQRLKHQNIYRLGHFLDAVSRFEVRAKDCKAIYVKDYYNILTHVFIYNSNSRGEYFDLPPVQRVATKLLKGVYNYE